MIDSERLHRAAEVVAKQDEPEDGGFAPDALDRFLDESTFLRELTGGTNEVGIHRGSMAYGIAVGVEAARLEAENETQE